MNKHLKIFLSFLSLVALLLGSCKVGDKLGSETQDSQINGGIAINTDIPSWSTNISSAYEGSQISYKKTNDINTSFPSWSTNVTSIPEEYRGKYQYLDEDGYRSIATVTERDITLYYKDDDGNLQVSEYFHVFDKNAEYWGDNNWSWPPSYRGDNYVNKYKNDFRITPLPDYIMKFKRNEKGQRVLFFNRGFDYVHEDDMNK